MDSNPRLEDRPPMAGPRASQPRLILTITLTICLPVVFILFLSLWIESVLKNRLVQDRIDEVFRDGQEWWGNFNQTIQTLERSTLNFARLVETRIAAPPNEDDPAAFDLTTRLEVDGTWRSRREVYSPTREAGIFIPRFVSMDKRMKSLFYRAWRTTTSFGSGAFGFPISDTWILPASGGITIIWPDEPGFVYEAEPDQDYSATEWMTLTHPETNPDRRARWKTPAIDPVPNAWLISVVAPFQVNNKWGGAVGHDIRISRFMEYAGPLTRVEGSHFTLITSDGHLLLSDFLQREIDHAGGKLRHDGLNDMAYSGILQTALEHSETMQEKELLTEEFAGQIVLVGKSCGPGWILVNTIPLKSITAQLHRPFQWLRLIVLASWVVTILAVIGIVLGDRYRNLTIQHALQESQERLEMALWGGDLGLWDLDITTRKRVVNQRYAEMLGYTVEEVENCPHFWEDKLHPDDKGRVIAASQANLDGKDEIFNAEYRLRHRDGSWRWIQDNGRVVQRDHEGRPLRASGVHQDITERKQAEETLRLREATLAGIFRAAPMIIGICMGRTIKWFNEYATIQMQYSPEDLSEQDTEILYKDKEEYERVGKEVQRQMSLGDQGFLETRWKRKDGTVMEILLSFSALDPLDASKGTIYTGLDVTEHKRAERELHATQEMEKSFTSKLALLHEVSMELNLCKTFDDLCRRAVELGRERLGFERIGIWFSCDDPQMMKGSFGVDETGAIRDERASIVKMANEWGDLFDERCPLILYTDDKLKDDRNDEVGQGNHVLAGMWDGHSVVGGVSVDNLISGKPITTRDCDLILLFAKTLGHLCTLKRAQENLLESEANLAHAQEIAKMGNWVWDPHTGAVTFSDQTWRLVGLDPTSSPQILQILEAVVEREELTRLRTQMWRAVEKGENRFESEFHFHTPDGVVHSGYALADIVRDETGNAIRVRGIIQDITERKHAEEERRVLEQQIQHTQKLESLGVLAGGIAHDFNNLLMAILGNADLALSSLPVTSTAHVHLAEIEGAARRAADLTGQMLAYSGRGQFLIEEVNLNELVTEMGNLLEASISKRAHLTYALTESLAAVKADATQLRQVVMNLIVNASEAIGDQEGLIHISTGSVKIPAGNHSDYYLGDTPGKGDYVFIEVSDSGCGMDEETRKRIFDPFFTTKFTGRGLGLAAVQGIVHGHKGTIQIHSEKGRGTIFRVLLPALDRTVTHTTHERMSIPSVPAGTTVLLVDDEEVVRSTGETMLQRMGCTVLLAVNGRDALKTLSQSPQPITCILLDLTMPFMDGVETLREVKKTRPDIPVVIMSGYTEHDTLQRFAEVSPDGFIQKPFNMGALQKAISQVFSSLS